jgi:hypothetical protein
LPAARWRLASGTVHPGSTSGVPGWHQTRRRGRERPREVGRCAVVERWWRDGAQRWVGGFPVVGDDATTALHLGEGERTVRGMYRQKEAWASGSPRGQTTVASQRKLKRSHGLQHLRQVARAL